MSSNYDKALKVFREGTQEDLQNFINTLTAKEISDLLLEISKHVDTSFIMSKLTGLLPDDLGDSDFSDN